MRYVIQIRLNYWHLTIAKIPSSIKIADLTLSLWRKNYPNVWPRLLTKGKSSTSTQTLLIAKENHDIIQT